MIRQLRISVLVDNTVTGRDLLAEHGLAFWVEADDHRVLFDTGQGLALRHNAERLGIDLRAAEAVVLSHGHYDHSGGLGPAADVLEGATLYAHPDVFQMRYAVHAGQAHTIGSPLRAPTDLAPQPAAFMPTSKVTRIADGIWATGEVPRRHPLEDTGGPFFLDAAGTQPDPIVDDQALIIEMPAGSVVLLGCAHAGVINTLHHVRDVTGGRPIHAVLGGTHLHAATEARLDATIRSFRDLDIRKIVPGHCTGQVSAARLLAALPDRCEPLAVGRQFVFQM